MIRWQEFAARAPEFAGAGARLLMPGGDGISIGFLATTAERGRPRLAPVCPIFCGPGIYLSVGAPTPKRADLALRGHYVLHAFLGAQDEEFQFSGRARRVDDASECEAVVDAIPFGAYDAEDPIFELLVERALWVVWENVGQPGSRPVKRRWSVHGEVVPHG